MKHFGVILTVLVLLCAAMLFFIFRPAQEAANSGPAEDKGAAAITKSAISTGEAIGAEDEINTENQPLRASFDLKYEKYLIAAPYTYDVNGEARTFQFNKMLDAIDKADREYEKGRLTYIDNYKNQNGWAPYYRGSSQDGSGNGRSASAPGYPDKANTEEFSYLSDGTLVRVLAEEEQFAHVSTVLDGKEYYVPEAYVPTDDCLTGLNKVIVIDRTNQNIASFEKRQKEAENGQIEDAQWVVVSYSLATTGKVGKYHQPTPLGYYSAIEKKPKFYYVKDGTDELEGSAPYAIRFSGGAYTHGVAVPFKYKADGTRIEGTVEYSETIGTVPLSHKCVRNYTSHAKFLYDWYVDGETIVIVIE